MRLKELKPGMVIKCNNKEERGILLKELERLGYIWFSTKDEPTKYIAGTRFTIHLYEANDTFPVKHITHSDGDGIDFQDLIIQKLSAVEVLRTMQSICRQHELCKNCPLTHICDSADVGDHAEKIIEICENWDARNQKKEVAVEWIDVCRIIQVRDNGKKECVKEIPVFDSISEGFTEWQLKEYIKEHEGNYFAVVERVCRVKV